MDRSDLDIPNGTVWPATDAGAEGAGVEGSGAEGAEGPGGIEAAEDLEQPVSLDPGRDDAERNAAGGGWEGASEQVENDFETEQLRRREGSA